MTMVTVAAIRSEPDYERALERIEEIFDAAPGSEEADELDILATLIEKYEAANYSVEPPTPVEAIQFRMEQQNLTARDLMPILGSRTRVSEILNGSRSLTLDMIRALNTHLGIPAETLIQEADEPSECTQRITAQVERILKGWNVLKAGEGFKDLMQNAFGARPAFAALRKSRTDRTNAKNDQGATQAWCAAAVLLSREVEVEGSFNREALANAMPKIADLSAVHDGMEQLQGTLSALGIAFVTLPHLPRTYLDGASVLREDGVPVVALSLRHDKADTFWFTLMHELAHVLKHLGQGQTAIVDDLELSSSNAIEREADRIAQNTLIPDSLWRRQDTGEFFSKKDLERLAADAKRDPAIIAGRWRMENKDYRRFSSYLGHRTVQKRFPDWQARKQKIA
ncbi:ImmA/IrrE family metallo-endopeptidase [Tsuneonella suprasediminis]|uniref:ImmA/IrrE family metallo-endopeptidase n=1 Tax=Tsuneonella suprasediminis TaxID=2306996 RepID=A0A419R364_9SPHN|nr:ImmA/IrrE family metallo-endopeptidase [Tsuneonella suprasediminis]RJX68527.1 ImmA/IrrE family metallo-endopeptidase [Tsuneonella suprasediminis]